MYIIQLLLCINGIQYCFFSPASKQPRLAIDEAVDDVLPLAIAQKFCERLNEQNSAEASISNQEANKRKKRGKKVDHLYCRSTTVLNYLEGLTPRPKVVMYDLGFDAILHFNIKEIPCYIAYWVLKSFNLTGCQIPLCGVGA